MILPQHIPARPNPPSHKSQQCPCAFKDPIVSMYAFHAPKALHVSPQVTWETKLPPKASALARPRHTHGIGRHASKRLEKLGVKTHPPPLPTQVAMNAADAPAH